MFDQSKIDIIAANFLDKLIRELIKGVIESGQNASGDTINSLGLQKRSDNEWVLFGRKFINALERGRGATKSGTSSTKTLQQRIYDWLPYADKYGITYNSEREKVSLSWAISKKIHKKGTYLHIQNKNTNIITKVISKENFSKFAKELLRYYGSVSLNRIKYGLES